MQGIPSSPFQVESSKDIIQRHIDAGDISQADIDLLQKGYKWMSLSAAVGSTSFAIPTYLYFRNRRPPTTMLMRIGGAGAMAMVGSFLGFTLGGFAAAVEVNKSMQDPQRKMQVFHDIAEEAREAAMARAAAGRQGISTERVEAQRPRPIVPPGVASTGVQRAGVESVGVETAPSTWASEAALDRQEMDMERAREGSAAGRDVKGSQSQPKGTEQEGRDAPVQGGWDRLRKQAFPQSDVKLDLPQVRAAQQTQPDGEKDSRSKEQKEFDALLEQERKGGPKDDKWA